MLMGLGKRVLEQRWLVESKVLVGRLYVDYLDLPRISQELNPSLSVRKALPLVELGQILEEELLEVLSNDLLLPDVVDVELVLLHLDDELSAFSLYG